MTTARSNGNGRVRRAWFAAVAALCAFAPAEAGEFASALVGRVTYTDTPGWSVAVGRWTTGAGLFKKLPPNWAGGFSSTLYSQAPVIAYFSDSNENRNGVVRKVLPKGRSFDDIAEEEMRRIDYMLNDRPAGKRHDPVRRDSQRKRKKW